MSVPLSLGLRMKCIVKSSIIYSGNKPQRTGKCEGGRRSARRALIRECKWSNANLSGRESDTLACSNYWRKITPTLTNSPRERERTSDVTISGAICGITIDYMAKKILVKMRQDRPRIPGKRNAGENMRNMQKKKTRNSIEKIELNDNYVMASHKAIRASIKLELHQIISW